MTFGILLLSLAQSPPSNEWVMMTVGADRPVTALVRLNNFDWTVDQTRIAASDWVELGRPSVPLPAWPRDAHVILANGDRLRGRAEAADGRTLQVKHPEYGNVSIPLTAVSLIALTRLPAVTPADPMSADWLKDRSSDIVRLINGDLFRGTVESLDAESLRIKPDKGAIRTIPRAEVAAIGFQASLSRVRPPRGRHAFLVLKDGSRLTAATVSFEERSWILKSAAGFDLTLPRDAVVNLVQRGGAATDLADLTPQRNITEPFLSDRWPMQRDRNVKGQPITLAGPRGISTFDRGLGTHPRTTLVYDLAGKYRRFDALLGLDAASGPRGRVDVAILVDGKPQAISRLTPLTAEVGIVPIRIDLSGAKSLTLKVDFGPGNGVQADVNWANARLISSP